MVVVVVVAMADRELRALVRDDAAVLFWTVSEPHQYPCPSTHGALAGASFHGALCAAVARGWDSVLPERLIGAGI